MNTAIAFYLFTAAWCGPCQVAVDGLRDDPRVAIVDIETAYGAELAREHGVRGLPELHSLESGQVKVGL